MFDEGYLPGPVTAVHRPDLGHRDMAFIHHEEEVVGEVVQQAEGPLPGLTPVEVAAVVLDAAAEAELAHHLEVVGGAFLEPLAFDEAALVVEPFHLLHHVLLDFPDALVQRVLAGDEEVGGVDAQ